MVIMSMLPAKVKYKHFHTIMLSNIVTCYMPDNLLGTSHIYFIRSVLETIPHGRNRYQPHSRDEESGAEKGSAARPAQLLHYTVFSTEQDH